MWHVEGHGKALQDIYELGMEPEPEDLPPALQWEYPIWKLFLRTQNHPEALVPIIQEHGLPLADTLELIGVIENVMFRKNPTH